MTNTRQRPNAAIGDTTEVITGSNGLDKTPMPWHTDAVSRTERRTRAQVAADTTVLVGYGIARVRPDSSKWYAYQCGTDGSVKYLTLLFEGSMRGEGKPNATGRLKRALFMHVGGLNE